MKKYLLFFAVRRVKAIHVTPSLVIEWYTWFKHDWKSNEAGPKKFVTEISFSWLIWTVGFAAGQLPPPAK
jgi:hypothetical protein